MKTKRQYTSPEVVEFVRDRTMATFTTSIPYGDSDGEDEMNGQYRSAPVDSFSKTAVKNTFDSNAYSSNSFTQERF